MKKIISKNSKKLNSSNGSNNSSNSFSLSENVNLYYNKYKSLFLSPNIFFKDVKKEGPLSAILFLLILTFAVTLLTNLLPFFGILSPFDDSTPTSTSNLLIASSIFLDPILAVIFSGIIATFLYLLIQLFTKKTEKKTEQKTDFFSLFKIMAYSRTISLFYSLLTTVLTLTIFLVTNTDLSSINMLKLLSFELGIPGTIVLALSAILAIMSAIHVIYTSTTGLMQYKKITFLKALALIFFAWVFIIVVSAIFSIFLTSLIFPPVQ